MALSVFALIMRYTYNIIFLPYHPGRISHVAHPKGTGWTFHPFATQPAEAGFLFHIAHSFAASEVT